MVKIKNLRVDFDTVCAVEDLTLTVSPGEVYGLIGPNGAGKTTTFRTLLGLIEPTYGEIEISGIDPRLKPREAVRHVGFMPDFPPMYDDLMAWEFLDLFAASYDMEKSSRGNAIDNVLGRLGLTEKRNAFIPELSRGMKQRLMLAKTLLPNPSVLLLDEPASGMDPHGRIELKNILVELAKEGKTILVSSHILTEMSEFCTSAGIMEKGRLRVTGTIAELEKNLSGGSSFQLETLGEIEKAFELLKTDTRIANITREDKALIVSIPGEEAVAAQVLKDLVSGGIPVIHFARRKYDLEALFLKVGAKELS